MIGYYVHHHGSGHRQRALAVARHLSPEVTLLGSLGPPAGVPAPYVELDRDDDPPPAAGEDVTADGSLHWAPLAHPGLRARHGALVRWMVDARADVLVSDVSVETLLLARLLSVPPVAVALRGDRADRPHTAGYDAAVRILAPWPRETQQEWPARWLAKTTWVGMISRFDGREPERSGCTADGTCVVLLLGRGGHVLQPVDLIEATAVPDAHWHVLGDAVPVNLDDGAAARLHRHGDVPDPWPWLCDADVVVAAAGDAAIADVAAARAPLVAVPQPRPFGEQADHARVLARHGACVTALPWPTRWAWPQLLERAMEVGGQAWAAHCDGRGAARAAEALLQVADEHRRGPRA